MMTHVFKAVLLSCVFSACTFNVRLVEKEPVVSDQMIGQLKTKEGSYAIVRIGDAEIACKVASVNRDALVLMSYDEVSEIPLKAVEQIKFVGKSVPPGVLAGGFVVGSLTGGLAGEAIADQAKPFKKSNHQLYFKIASAAVGGFLGLLTAKGLSGTEDPGEFVINPKIKPFKLDKRIGKSIPGLVVSQQGLFQDFQLKAGEQLLSVQLYEYDTNEYLALYELHNGYHTLYRWDTVDAGYLQAQRSKIKLPIQNEMFKEELKNDPLKIFNEENNKQ